MSTSSPQVPADFDFTDPLVNEGGIPHERFAAARATAPIHWVEQPPGSRSGFPGTGYWAVTRHADVVEVSKNVADFSVWENGAIIRLPEGVTRDQVEIQRVMLINQDPPDHTRYRAIVSRGFTPRSVELLRSDLERRAHGIVTAAREKGSGNFVEDIAMELPLQAIAELLGVPPEDRAKLFEWSNTMMAYDDLQPGQDPELASIELFSYFLAMAEERKVSPRDDIVTKLIQTDVHGEEGMGTDQFGYFVTLLSVAGNETTRNAITHGMNAFFENPDQWAHYQQHRPVTAVDEILRWASPVIAFQRTAVRDVRVGDQVVGKGERVGIFYSSANFDPQAFDDPMRFDILREKNPHLAFGGHGAHYCVGANLARMEVDIMFNAIADILPDIAKVADPLRQRHSWINGVRELGVTYR
ncbi:MAG: steroid C27-monooxygenase [Marmoricola sp.]|nr:steroid C27-monooxygenase [Marmoricola sp.]